MDGLNLPPKKLCSTFHSNDAVLISRLGYLYMHAGHAPLSRAATPDLFDDSHTESRNLSGKVLSIVLT